MSSPTSSRSEPSRSEAWRRLRAARPPPWVMRHCLCVEGLAAAMAERARGQGLDVDGTRVARGALLHDIGRSVSQGIDHACIGADMLRQPPAWPEPIVRIVETHTGAGLAADEARAAGLPERDYIPRTLEQRIVAHADNLLSGEKRMRLEQVLSKYEARGLDAAGRRIAKLHEELEASLALDLEALGPLPLPAP